MVVGHSGGASIACELVARHPELVRRAVLYEAPLVAVVPDGEAVVAGFRAVIDRAMAEGGPRRAMEAFMRANASDEVVDRVLASVPPAELDRILGNGAVLFELELPMCAGFVPDTDGMRTGGVPLTVALGAENRGTWYRPRPPGWPRAPAPSWWSCPATTGACSPTRRRWWSWCGPSRPPVAAVAGVVAPAPCRQVERDQQRQKNQHLHVFSTSSSRDRPRPRG
jgi:pimeloyl-ACP methyl ester carboxylesterase